MVARPENRRLRLDRPALRIIDLDLADRVDAGRLDRRSRYLASVAKGAGARTGAREVPALRRAARLPVVWRSLRGAHQALEGSRERPHLQHAPTQAGVCTNTLALIITGTDDEVLGIVEGEVLGTRFIEELARDVAANAL